MDEYTTATIDFVDSLIRKYIDKHYPDNQGYELKVGLISDTMDTTTIRTIIKFKEGDREIDLKASEICYRQPLDIPQMEVYIKAKCPKYGKSNIHERAEKAVERYMKKHMHEKAESEYNEKNEDAIEKHMQAVEDLYGQGYYKEAANNIRQILETMLENLIIKYKPELALDKNIGVWIDALKSKGVITDSQMRSLYRLRDIGNAGSHNDGKVNKKDIMMAIPVLKDIIEYYKSI